MPRRQRNLLDDLSRIYAAARESDDGDRCCVAPAPQLVDRMRAELRTLAAAAGPTLRPFLAMRRQKRVGFNDGLIVPGDRLPLGAPPSMARAVALKRALRNEVNVVIVLVDFADKALAKTKAHFENLFFSANPANRTSVRDYFEEVSNGLVRITGEVVGPYRLPKTMAAYANGDSGTGLAQPNARTMALDAAKAANPDVDFGKYDNDGDGFVDAYVVVHAGRGAEQTGSPDDIWSHKWTLPGGAFQADAARIFAYLTVPEDARIGVCAHELGHLLFGFPDLYDTDSSSEGIGNFCLMAGGSWLGNGDVPCHPSAWCKIKQGWITQENVATDSTVAIKDVKTGKRAYRLWKKGKPSNEYFLVENRQKTGFDRKLPADGLFVWHIDETIGDNDDERHYKVALEQADGKLQLEGAGNRGDAGDSFPGSANKRVFDAVSTPGSRSYGGRDTRVAIGAIANSAASMSVSLKVGTGAPQPTSARPVDGRKPAKANPARRRGKR